jgi:hypothetical protein
MSKQQAIELSAGRGVPDSRAGTSFSERFCAITGTRAEMFDRKLFKKSLYAHARIVAPFLLKFRPEMFREDFEAIRELAMVDCPEIFAMEVNRFHGRNKRDRSILRQLFLIRVSGKRLLKWKAKCFPAENVASLELESN